MDAPHTTIGLPRRIAFGIGFIFVYLAALIAAPIAIVVLLVAGMSRWLKPDESEKEVSMAGLIWVFVVFSAGMVLNVIFLPIWLCWQWIAGGDASRTSQ